jgi:hypothetical protein
MRLRLQLRIGRDGKISLDVTADQNVYEMPAKGTTLPVRNPPSSALMMTLPVTSKLPYGLILTPIEPSVRL